MGGPALCNGKVIEELGSNYLCEFFYGGMIWISSEQLFQALKFKDIKYREKINRQHDIYTIQKLGNSTTEELVDNYDEATFVYIAEKEKFKQNPHLMKILTSTYPHNIFFYYLNDVKTDKIRSSVLKYLRENKVQK